MSNISLTLPAGETAQDGKMITFRAPTSCGSIDRIFVDGQQYDLVDSCGKTLSRNAGSFSSGCLVGVLLDTTNSKAFVLNSSYVGVAKIVQDYRRFTHNISIIANSSTLNGGEPVLVNFSIVNEVSQKYTDSYDISVDIMDQATSLQDCFIPAGGLIVHRGQKGVVCGVSVETGTDGPALYVKYVLEGAMEISKTKILFGTSSTIVDWVVPF